MHSVRCRICLLCFVNQQLAAGELVYAANIACNLEQQKSSGYITGVDRLVFLFN